jgi:hypothetical protein
VTAQVGKQPRPGRRDRTFPMTWIASFAWFGITLVTVVHPTIRGRLRGVRDACHE